MGGQSEREVPKFRPSPRATVSGIAQTRWLNVQEDFGVKHTFCQVAQAILAFAFPVAALADISGSPTLPSNTALNLDTGATAASGGDLLWNGTTFAPQGKAKAYNVGNASTLGALFYSVFTPTSTYSIVATSAPIAASALVSGEVFAVFTNGGNIAKMSVTANSGGSLSLQFMTYIAAAPTGPAVTQIWNNSSNIPGGYPNSGVTPSSIVAIVGTGLADPGDATLHSSEGAGIQNTLNGASVTLTTGSTISHPGLYYATPTQLDVVLPASTPLGSASIKVTYKGVTSNAFTIQVVASAPGITNYNGGVAVATDAVTGALIGYTNSATPGEVLIIWATGLGADPADSDTVYTPSPHPLNTISVQIYLGGVPVEVGYQGASIYPGVDVFAITIPQSPPTGCYISLAVVAGGVPGNTTSLPISGSGGACIDEVNGLTGNQISPSGGVTLRTGLVSLVQSDRQAKNGAHTVTTSANAAFETYTGLHTPNNAVSPGGCIVSDLAVVPVGNITGLDPGTINFAGTGGISGTMTTQFGIKGAFTLSLTPAAIPQSGGSYTFTGTGGADVGSFTSTLNFANPIIAWTNPSDAATIDRSQELVVNWTGGNPGSYVFVTGTSTSAAPAVTGGFTCLAKVDAGQIKVPSYILSALPAGSGAIGIQNDTYLPLTPTGIDTGQAVGEIDFSVTSTFK